MEGSACLSGMSAVAYWREVRSHVSRDNAMDPDDPAFKPLLVRLLSEDFCVLDLTAMPRRLPDSSVPCSAATSM